MFNIDIAQLSEFDHKNVKIIKKRVNITSFNALSQDNANVKTTLIRVLI